MHLFQMSDSNEEWLDADIRNLNLSYGQKSGLQVFRNYKKSFEKYALERFREDLDRENLDLNDLEKVTNLLANEDVRFLPVIACGYSDDLLKQMFQKILPVDIPGGTGEMLNAYGPLSDLSKRIRLAFAFDELSRDLMADLDRVRSARNRIAHDWDVGVLENFHLRGRIADITPIETLWFERHRTPDEPPVTLSPHVSFRIRLIWIVGRVTYEVHAYHRAKKAQLDPYRALYEEKTKWLSEVARVCGEASALAVNQAQT